MFNHLRNCQTIFHTSCVILHSTSSIGRCQFLHIFVNAFLVLFFLIFIAILSGYEVVSHCGFDLHFPDGIMLSIIFSYTY